MSIKNPNFMLIKKCSSKNLLFVEICVVELIQQRCSSIFNIEPTNQRVRMTSLNQIWDASNLVPLFRPLSLAVSGAIHWQENILFYMSVIIHWKYTYDVIEPNMKGEEFGSSLQFPLLPPP